VSALIARAEAHSPEAGFGERIAENQRRVFQIAFSILGNSADAEDVAQEAFLRAYQRFTSLREAEKFRAWVDRLRTEIERLPEKLRSVLQLSLVEEMGAADVGAVLGIPAGTVRSRVHTARTLLLEVMK
jgi:DNA-directed RNA polymerase specialized sigma24 family protein